MRRQPAMGPRLRPDANRIDPPEVPQLPRQRTRWQKCTRLVGKSTVSFLFRALVLAAVSPASLIKLALRFLTVFLVIMHY